jgi:hypothetical protein
MRYLLFALALLGSISLVTVPTMTYADPGKGGTANGVGGEGKTSGGHSDPSCGEGHGASGMIGDEC